MEYTVAQPLSAIELHRGQTLEELESLLTELGLDPQLTKKDIRLICPCCPNSKERTLSVYIQGSPKWKCFKCDASRKKFNNLIGLYRNYYDTNPWGAVNKLFDTAFANDSKSKTRFPLEIGDLKHKPLSDIPPHKLYWVLIAGLAKNITQDLKDEITARLYDVAPF